MGYYIDGSGFYYEGDIQSPTDTVVTQRPYVTCNWNAGLAAWEYDLPATRIRHKNYYNTDMTNDMMAALESSSSPASVIVLVAIMALRMDGITYIDNVANTTPVYDAYETESGLANTAAVHAAVYTDFDLILGVFGQLLALRDADFALIDAAPSGPDILAITYVSPL